ncbi:hypothetical protein [Streptomyces sp. NPDC058045]|uniref:HD domain-containing protein n=1 Tax=Streptomyces sp. NPDC058045 TaxID=3346311 RepID=UPI0036E1ADFF
MVDRSTTSPQPEPHPATEELHRRWCETLIRARSGATAPPPGPYADRLLARWAEPQRHYHSTDHLLNVLDQVDSLAAHAEQPDLVRLAAWFHDAVYRPNRSENEERSAALAERALREAGLGASGVREVVRLVQLTTTHDPRGGDTNGEVLCDADLSVLGGEPAQYAAYVAAVRAEYSFVPDADFRTGRAAVLRQLLDMPALFRTPGGAGRWESPARRNMRAELAVLTP